jgi:hypothetical protein
MLSVNLILSRCSTILTDAKFVRWTTDELIGWINDGAAEIVIRRPAAHAVIEQLVLVAGAVQRIPDGGIEVLDVTRNFSPDGLVPGKAIGRTDLQLLSDQKPDWFTMKEKGEIKHYTFDERSPQTFYVYPPAKAGTRVEAMYSAAFPLVASGADTLQLDRVYLGPLVSYVLYRALAKDSEYANGAVALAHFQAFNEAVGTRNQMTVAASPNVASV